MSSISLVAAGAQDLEAIALLHAQSWRSTYRGIVPDEFLDRHADADRREFWTARAAPGTAMHLWCVEGNAVARRFYERQGGAIVEAANRPFAGQASMAELRYWWAPLPP